MYIFINKESGFLDDNNECNVERIGWKDLVIEFNKFIWCKKFI
jgi:hypothetical protein